MQERVSIRDRLSALSARELVALALVAAVVVAGAALWYARSLPRTVEVRSGQGPAPPPGPVTSGPTATPSPSTLFVHVAGLVRHPGVYEFRPGQRVIDAVTAAGGPRKKADLDALNLAALLTDGEQVLVPTRGTAWPGTPVTGSSPGSTLVNVNTATEQELEALPGIGPVLAQKIIDYRTEHGPFPTVDALDDVSGIGPATLEDLRPLVTV